jgi:hypothetical protein
VILPLFPPAQPPRDEPEKTPTVQVDDWGVRRLGRDEAIAWPDIERIEVVTTDEGPWQEDFFWLLESAEEKGVAIGGDEAEACRLLAVLQQRYLDLDNEGVIRAVRSTQNASFLIWRRRTY